MSIKGGMDLRRREFTKDECCTRNYTTIIIYINSSDKPSCAEKNIRRSKAHN